MLATPRSIHLPTIILTQYIQSALLTLFLTWLSILFFTNHPILSTPITIPTQFDSDKPTPLFSWSALLRSTLLPLIVVLRLNLCVDITNGDLRQATVLARDVVEILPKCQYFSTFPTKRHKMGFYCTKFSFFPYFNLFSRGEKTRPPP